MTSVLVAYASKHGATKEIAEAIASGLRENGLAVDCREVGDVRDLAGYDAVVLGSAVYMKRWRGEAKAFLRSRADELSQLPFWVFSSGPVGEPAKTPNGSWLEPPRVMGRVEHLGAREHVVFGGRVPADPHGPIERAMAKGTPPAYRDMRDWDAVRAWTERIASELAPVAVP